MIELEGVYKSYGAIRVVDGIGFRIDDGKSLCLQGKSGCGKSTLLKMMALIARPDKGNVIIDGKNITAMRDAEMDGARREKISYTFQEPLLIPYVTALENVTEVTGAPKDRAEEVLTQLGLRNRLGHLPPKLSGGEKKRVDIARAILRQTSILVADEPLANLDPETGDRVMGLLKAHVERGGVLVYSSVEPSDARFASRAISMENK